MNIKFKRRLTYGTILAFNLSTGLGYAIIFPTIWNYIHERLGGESAMLGVVISAYSLSSIFANPLVGWWSDHTLNTRRILLVTIMAEVIGSILYFVGMHLWVLVVGRLIAGIGAGGGAAVLADITRTTSEEDRTSVLSVVIASRQLGLIIGPAFNLFLSDIDFTLWNLPVDKFTSPGLFMAILWLLLEIIVLFAYYNLTSLQDDEDVENLFSNYNSGTIPYGDLDNLSTLEVAFTNSYPPYSGSIATTLDPPTDGNLLFSASQPNLHVEWFERSDTHTLKNEEIETINCQAVLTETDSSKLSPARPFLKRLRKEEKRAGSVSDKMIESAERLIQSTSGSYANYYDDNVLDKGDNANSSTDPSTPVSSEPISLPTEKTSLLGHVSSDNFRDEIVVLLGLAFISCFAQTVLETIVTPLAQTYYHFTEMDNSYLYLFAGVEVIIVFAVIKYVSRRVSDRVLIVVGLVTLSAAMALPIFYVPSAKPGDTTTLVYFIVTVVIDLVGIATIVVCSSSLLSKLTNDNNQAIFQGFRRSMCSLGCIMGPLWGGAFLFNMYILFSIPLAVIALITVLFILSYKKLTVEQI